MSAAFLLASATLAGSAAADGHDDHGHGAHRRFAWLANDATNTYDAATLAGLRDVAGAHATIDPFYAGFDPDTQLAQCFSALASRAYEGLFIEAASATGIEPCVARAPRLGVPVVATDLPIGPDPTTVTPQVRGEVGACFLTATEFGQAVPAMVTEARQGLAACNVLYVAGDETFVFDQGGILAVEQVAAAVPTVHLIDHVQALYDTATARAVVNQALAAHPEINFVLASGDQMALGAEQAATDSGVTLRILGGGAGASALAAVEAGRWYATFNALPRTEERLGGQLMARARRDDDTAPTGIDPIARAATLSGGRPARWRSSRPSRASGPAREGRLRARRRPEGSRLGAPPGNPPRRRGEHESRLDGPGRRRASEGACPVARASSAGVRVQPKVPPIDTLVRRRDK